MLYIVVSRLLSNITDTFICLFVLYAKQSKQTTFTLKFNVHSLIIKKRMNKKSNILSLTCSCGRVGGDGEWRHAL